MKQFIFLFLFLLTFFCAARTNAQLQAQADVAANAFWDSRMSDCEGEYYSAESKIVYEFNNPQVLVESWNVTAADRLNGLEFRGRTILAPSAMRRYTDNRWSEWVSVGKKIFADISKKNGHWNVTPDKFNKAFYLHPVKCSNPLALPADKPALIEEPTVESKTVTRSDLNRLATSLPKPLYPKEARAAHAKGVVSVEVLINEKGEVISATAISGHPSLKAAAVTAARLARFDPYLSSGQPARVMGVLNYDFTP